MAATAREQAEELAGMLAQREALIERRRVNGVELVDALALRRAAMLSAKAGDLSRGDAAIFSLRLTEEGLAEELREIDQAIRITQAQLGRRS